MTGQNPTPLELTTARALRFWLLALLGVVVLFYLLRDMLLPFVAGMAVAYFLDPVADRLESWRVPRGVASFAIIIAFFALLIIFLVLLYPLLESQIVGFWDRLPFYIERANQSFVPAIKDALVVFIGTDGSEIDLAVQEGIDWISQDGLQFVGDVFIGGINVVLLTLITPVVGFFLLKDWDAMVDKVNSWLPHDYSGIIREQSSLVDSALAGFVRGQATVCIILGTLYAVGWTLVGLDFGLVIGLMTGLFAFVPYAGAFIGLFLASVIAAVQFLPDLAQFALVIGVFGVVQALDAALITPRLMGSSINLHPVWILFALMAGATVGGFLGVLVAVPTAAILGVLSRFAIGQYLGSAYYLGRNGKAPSAANEITETSEAE